MTEIIMYLHFGNNNLVIVLVFITFFLFFVWIAYLRANRAKRIGRKGEKKVSYILSKLGKEYMVFNDVLIKNVYGTSQIDHLVVSPYGIFVIETKNYQGWIFGGADSETWTQNIWGNKYELNNPIRQNRGHIIALKKALPVFAYNQYVSIIVFSRRSVLKINVDDSYNVVYTKGLLNRIKQYQDIILSNEQQNEYLAVLRSFLQANKEEKTAHINSVKVKAAERETLINAHICPRCGGSLVLRHGAFGTFYGCSNYPKCKYTKS